jgi:hypothetical protein
MEPLVPSHPASTNAAAKDPRMEPRVLAAYSTPMLPPVRRTDGLISRPASGNP